MHSLRHPTGEATAKTGTLPRTTNPDRVFCERPPVRPITGGRFATRQDIVRALKAFAAGTDDIDSEIVLGHEGELSRVRISRIEPYNISFSFYGILFVKLGEHLQQFVDSVTQRRRAQTSA
ncbi:MAG: hypothetical protein ABJD24_13985 [Acidimicrobiales bacterium]